jgi:hypothetical protein
VPGHESACSWQCEGCYFAGGRGREHQGKSLISFPEDRSIWGQDRGSGGLRSIRRAVRLKVGYSERPNGGCTGVPTLLKSRPQAEQTRYAGPAHGRGQLSVECAFLVGSVHHGLRPQEGFPRNQPRDGRQPTAGCALERSSPGAGYRCCRNAAGGVGQPREIADWESPVRSGTIVR